MNEDKIIKNWDPDIMKRLIGYLAPYRGKIFIASIALVVLILSELLVPVIIQHSIDNNLLSETVSVAGLRRDSILLLFLLISGLAASFVQVYLMSYAGQGIMKTLRVQLLEHTAGQSLSYLGSKPVGSLVTRITNDVETISELFSTVIMTLIQNFLVMGGVIFVLFYLDVKLGAVTVITLPPVIILTMVFRKRARTTYRRVREKVSAVNAFLSERISGMKVVQVFAREVRTREQFVERNNALLAADFSEMYVFAIFRPLINLLSTVSLAVIIYFGAGLNAKGILSLGVLIAYLDLIRMFFRPLQQISEQFTIMQSAIAGGERVFELLDTEDRIPDYADNNSHLPDLCCCADDEDDSNTATTISAAVEFDSVHFSYKENEPVLNGISFSALKGETMAIVGYTGSGKTTIANLAARFWDADEGCIKIGGIDSRKIPLAELRRTVQAVQQDVFLFSGTIRDNIALGKEFSDNQLLEAAETSCLRPVLERLAGGLDYILTEGGTNLSGGQRQLVAFARVIAHNPPVLILDEATASIDTETEKLIQAGLKNLLKNRTAIVIAHRLSTIRDADRILVLGGGKIIESGTHDDLIAQGGFYSNLYNLQFGLN